jgi:hypothetical protein
MYEIETIHKLNEITTQAQSNTSYEVTTTANLMNQRNLERKADVCARCGLTEAGLGSSDTDLCEDCHREVIEGDFSRRRMRRRLEK